MSNLPPTQAPVLSGGRPDDAGAAKNCVLPVYMLYLHQNTVIISQIVFPSIGFCPTPENVAFLDSCPIFRVSSTLRL